VQLWTRRCERRRKTCYNRKIVITKDTTYIDSTAFKCGDTEVTTPFDHYLDPILRTGTGTLDSGALYPNLKPPSPKDFK
jgi:hypothetical protein